MTYNPEIPENAIGRGTPQGVGVVGLPASAETSHVKARDLAQSRLESQTIDPALGEAAIDYIEMVDDAFAYRGKGRGRVERAPDVKPLNFLVHSLPQGGHLFVLMAQNSVKEPGVSLQQLKDHGVNAKWIDQETWAASFSKVQMPVKKDGEISQIIIPFDEHEDMTSEMLSEAAIDAHIANKINDEQLMDLLDYIAFRELKRGKTWEPQLVDIFDKENNFGKGLLFTFPEVSNDE